MSVPATCTRCGFRFTSRALRIRNAINITIRDIGETCPRCGGLAKLQDGTYDFVGEVLAAVRAPGVMRQDVLAFQGVARAVQEGVLSFEDASEQLAQINSAFATLWKWMNDNGAAITVVLTVIALYIAMLTKESSDSSGIQAHLDAQQQIQATQSQAQMQQKIYELLQREHSPDGLLTAPVPHTPPTIASHLLRRSMSVKTLNRHERRKASRLAKR